MEMATKSHIMDRLRTGWLPAIAVAVGIGCILLLFPLVRSLHLDSAMFAGTIGAFAGAWMASGPKSRDRDVLVLTGFIYAIALPLIIRDGVTGCLSTDGAAFWLFIPAFSICFGFSAGRAARRLAIPLPRLSSIVFVFLVGAGGVLLSMRFLPQLYFFNHVFGYWPGAIYDQAVLFPGRMILYRFITLGWIAVFWMLPHLRGSDRLLKGIFVLLLLSVSLNYLLASQHGIISPESRIQSGLGGVHHTPHFALYYSKTDFDPHEVAFLGRLHEFHFRELTDTLRVSWPEGKRISSYLYGDEWQMQQYTGAKGVSYVPVWHRRPQMHMRKTAIDGTLRHEMVHVIARQFGNRLLNASWSVGLVEGLAVALAPASSTRLTHDQMVVANEAFYSQDELERLFSLTGFYQRPGAAAYGVSGSFAATLLREYPVELFKEAYRRSSLHHGYGERLPEAVEMWHRQVSEVTVSEEEGALAGALFTAPTLFDERCPRNVTALQGKREAFRFALARGDSARALTLLDEVLEAEPRWEAGWMQWFQLRLEMDRPEKATGMFEASAAMNPELMDNALLRVRLADAYMAAGQRGKARELREGSLTLLRGEKRAVPPTLALRQAEQAWQRRPDADLWQNLVRVMYKPGLSLEQPPGFVVASGDPLLVRVFFAEWFRRNPIPSVAFLHAGSAAGEYASTEHSAAEQEASEDIAMHLIRQALEPPIDPHFFETYRNLIYLASPVLPAGFFEEQLTGERVDGAWPGDEGWRPVRQARLEEALRFAGS